MKRQYLALIAGMTLMSAMGSIHAFSIFLAPWEKAFRLPRADISLIYSLALVFLTMSVLIGHRLYALIRPAIMVLVAGLVAASGVLLAGNADSLTGALIGYSFIFGAANGIGYGFTLQIAARATPDRKGFAMAIVTASYGIGSMIFPYLSERTLKTDGVAGAMELLAGMLVLAGVLSSVLLYLSAVRYEQQREAGEDGSISSGLTSLSPPRAGSLQAKLWLAYGAGVAAGLMAIGHAAGIIAANGGGAHEVLSAPVMVALGIVLGGVSIGFLLDRVSPRKIVIVLAFISAIVLIGISETESSTLILVALSIVGWCYGASIAAYPAAVAVYFGVLQAPSVYGRVFTAWGAFGLAAPWLAGVLYDITGGYGLALQLAGGCAILSVLVAILLPREESIEAIEGPCR